MRIFANSEDPDEMPHIVSFHQCLHNLLKDKNYHQRKKYIFYLGIITCDPSIYEIDHPKFIILNQKEESISA